MRIRKLIAATGAVTVATAVALSVGAGTADAHPLDCASLHRASYRAAVLMGLYMEMEDFAASDAQYTVWVNTEAVLEMAGC